MNLLSHTNYNLRPPKVLKRIHWEFFIYLQYFFNYTFIHAVVNICYHYDQHILKFKKKLLGHRLKISMNDVIVAVYSIFKNFPLQSFHAQC